MRVTRQIARILLFLIFALGLIFATQKLLRTDMRPYMNSVNDLYENATAFVNAGQIKTILNAPAPIPPDSLKAKNPTLVISPQQDEKSDSVEVFAVSEQGEQNHPAQAAISSGIDSAAERLARFIKNKPLTAFVPALALLSFAFYKLSVAMRRDTDDEFF